jgi:hypothetical protein
VRGGASSHRLRERFLALDVTGTGRVAKHEWLRFSLREALKRSTSKIIAIFHAWDADGSGYVDQLEFRKAIKAIGYADVGDKHIDHVFREFDDDRVHPRPTRPPLAHIHAHTRPHTRRAPRRCRYNSTLCGARRPRPPAHPAAGKMRCTRRC